MGMVVDAPSAQNGNAVAATAGDAAVERPKLTRAEQAAADKAAFLAGIDGELAGDGAEPEKKPAKPAPKKPVDNDDDGDDGTDDDEDVDIDDEEDEDDLDDDDDDEEDEEEDDESDPESDDQDEKADKESDPDLKKRLAQVRKREQRMRAQAEERDRDFSKKQETFLAEWKPKMAALEQFEKLKERKSDPAGLLKALGYDDEEFAEISQILWGLSKAGASDPKYREASKRLLKDRELAEDAAAARREATELRERLDRRDQESEADRKIEAYRGRVIKAVTDETPLVKKKLELAPKRAQKELDKVALKLAKKAGAIVAPAKVVKAWEKKLRANVESARALAGEDAPIAAPPKKKAAAAESAKKAAPAPKADEVETKTTPTGRPHIPTREEMMAGLARAARESDELT